jgi:hypothetical protein
MGLGGGGDDDGRPFRLTLDLDPVVFLAMAHDDCAKTTIEKGVIEIDSQSETWSSRVRIEMASGQLLDCVVTPDSVPCQLRIAFEPGALNRRWAEVEGATAKHENCYDAKSPLDSIGRYLAGTEDLWTVLAMSNSGDKAILAEIGMLRKLLAAGILRVADAAVADCWPPKDSTGFSVSAANEPRSGFNGALAMAAWCMLRGSDAAFPRGSWPWTLSRTGALTLAAAATGSDATGPSYEPLNPSLYGSDSSTDQLFDDILQENKMAKGAGSLPCLFAGWLCSSPPRVTALATAGLNHLALADFRRDYEVLTRAGGPAQRYAVPLAEAVGTLDDRELAMLFPEVPSPELRAVLQAVCHVESPHGGENLSRLLDALWQKGLAEAVKRELTQLLPRPAAESQAAGRPDGAKRR